MKFNPDPTKQATEVLFSCKEVSPNHPQLIFNGTDVVKVNEQKHPPARLIFRKTS